MPDHEHEHEHEHDSEHGADHIDGGLAHDLPRVLTRRRALGGLFGGAGLALLAACGSGNGSTSGSATTSTTSTSTGQPGPGGQPPGGSTTVGEGEIPEETAGPYPGDGSNGVNALAQSGIVRSDLRSSFGGATGVAKGVPLTIRLKVVDVSNGAKPLEGAALYLWHCDREGRYSLYSPGVTEENYLRGVQAADATGTVEFQSIYPGAYSGRWPHIHFEVYESLAKATSASNKLRTSQLALPEDVSRTVYATTGYEQSLPNLAQTSLDSDNVFSDGYSLQLATVTGNVTDGFAATLTVPV